MCTSGGHGRCAFPFIFKGTSYENCTNVDASAPWCAYLVDAYGEMGAWDWCGARKPWCSKYKNSQYSIKILAYIVRNWQLKICI